MDKEFTVITLLGIRPDIIRMFKIIDLLDAGQASGKYKHIFCHTGQHFDYELDEVFYKELGVRRPDWNMNVGKILKESGKPTTSTYQMALLFEKTEEMITTFKPDLVVYLGDTNSVVSSVIVSRLGVPVVHIEAGGRSFDWRMPEEKNRTIIDHLSDAHYCYTKRHRDNLLAEGIPESRINVIGNVIYDALDAFLEKADTCNTLETLGLSSKDFALVTLHREENTSSKESLEEKFSELIRLSKEMKVVIPLMPRVRNNLEKFGLLKMVEESQIIITKPLGYFDFLKLQKEAKIIITDSGTVQEEACILGVPALICRQSTERPETVGIKASILSEKDIYDNAKRLLTFKTDWDRMIMNPSGNSPSEVVVNDLLEKIGSGYFATNRQMKNLPQTKEIREAYGHFNE